MVQRSNAWCEGYDAYLDGTSACPYADKTTEAADWDEGYQQASYDGERDIGDDGEGE